MKLIAEKYEFECAWDHVTKSWILTIFVKNDIERAEFLETCLTCDRCRQKLTRDMKIYFCVEGKKFYHKPCVLRSNHSRLYQTYNEPEHEDYLVTLEFIYPKLENNKV